MNGTTASQAADAPEACLSATRALCNVCGKLTEAKVVIRGDRVLLVKWCAEHGRTEALVCSDYGWYKRSSGYVKPGTRPLRHSVASYCGCPDSCGLCAQHQQHTCVPIIEITKRCGLACPICIVGDSDSKDLSVKQVCEIVDNLIRCEGRLNMLNLSGGEPTLHEDFLQIVDTVRRPEIGIVSVSTDGLALSKSDDLIRELRDRGVVISLQFDGFRPKTYEVLRGKAGLADIKQRLVERILELGAKLSLTVTVARGVNEDELGSILELLFSHNSILSMMVQPVAHAGRARSQFPGDAMDCVTIPDVVRLLADGSHGALTRDDFTPLPCSHPNCFALTYLLKSEDGRLFSLPRILDAEGYLDIIKNEALFATNSESLERVRDSLYTLWSSNGQIPDREGVLKTVRQIMLDLNQLGPSAQHREILELGTKHVKSIFIHHFMDRYTFDLARAMKCCNHYPQVDGKLLPACVRNNLNLC